MGPSPAQWSLQCCAVLFTVAHRVTAPRRSSDSAEFSRADESKSSAGLLQPIKLSTADSFHCGLLVWLGRQRLLQPSRAEPSVPSACSETATLCGLCTVCSDKLRSAGPSAYLTTLRAHSSPTARSHCGYAVRSGDQHTLSGFQATERTNERHRAAVHSKARQRMRTSRSKRPALP